MGRKLRERRKRQSQQREQQSMCTGKRRLKAQADAEAHMEEVRALNVATGRSRLNRGLHVYQCPLCGGWHVGHKMRLSRKGDG